MKAIVLVLFCALVSAAHAQSFLPLQVGNQWIYQSGLGDSATDTRTVEVTSTESVNDVEYYVVRSLMGGEERLRYAAPGVLVVLTEDGTESLLADFNRQTGERYEAKGAFCAGPALVQSRAATVKLDAAVLERGFDVRYEPGVCRDAGITRDVYVPGIGLAERELTSIAGPQVYRLIYARVGSRVLEARKQLSIRLTLALCVPFRIKVRSQTHDREFYWSTRSPQVQ